ncbi:MAG TPA: flagella basal body P-ring formation protein FlgA [Brevundimonas sp.]|uniref:flagella basal body P-ring formation protein FlgA n=1 Tax=Brevundimonas sp. TaxID=1871086 RepID=UPI00261627E2|nr:flagella basal body P-ring formation protein FlgA [Brevundimonas sp.]HRO32067.1 flagella basal body P-ring formation protein FlgA [Brevundimonas sp.]
MSILFPLNPPPRPPLFSRRARWTAAWVAAVAAVLAATPALSGPVTLKAQPVDSDGRVTLGDLFDGAGAAADVQVATRAGPSVVLEAGQLQMLARQSGLEWSNPQGLRRVVVRNAALSPGAAAAQPAEASATPAAATMTPSRAVAAERVIARNDVVSVAYQVGGVTLTVMGRAQRNAAVGEPVAILNPTSGRMIDAVAIGPGQAMAGPAAQAARTAALQQFAAR